MRECQIVTHFSINHGLGSVIWPFTLTAFMLI